MYVFKADFVAKNSDFQEMVKAIANAALDVSNTDQLAEASINGKKVSDTLTDNIAKIGENMTLFAFCNAACRYFR